MNEPGPTILGVFVRAWDVETQCSNSTYDTGESFTQIGDLGHLGGWYWLRKNDIDGH